MSTPAPHLPPSGSAVPEAARYLAPLLTMNRYGRPAEGGQPRANQKGVLFRAAVTHEMGPGLHITFPTSSERRSLPLGTAAGARPALQSQVCVSHPGGPLPCRGGRWPSALAIHLQGSRQKRQTRSACSLPRENISSTPLLVSQD